MTDSTQLFSNRVENYALYRPSYPPAVLACLQRECGLTAAAVVADIGSGTGLLAELFLKNGNHVFGVEPNQAMREAAETLLAGYPNFNSIAGRAEATTLSAENIDLITAGQSFHWFDPQPAKVEFRRILRPEGLVALIWNERSQDDLAFMTAYELLLREYALNYGSFAQKHEHEPGLTLLFAGKQTLREFPNEQRLDFESLLGRHLSSSYTPLADHPRYEAMLGELRALFDQFQENGQIRFLYITRLYFGPLA